MPYIPQSVAVAEAKKVDPEARPKQYKGRCYFLKGATRGILGSGSDWLGALVDMERRAVVQWMDKRKLMSMTTADSKLVIVHVEPVQVQPEVYDVVSPTFDNMRLLCLWWRENRTKETLLSLGRIVPTPRVEIVNPEGEAVSSQA